MSDAALVFPIAGVLFAVGAVYLLASATLSFLRRSRSETVIRAQESADFSARLEASRTEQSPVVTVEGWSGYRHFIVRKKVLENSLTASIYLEPTDKAILPPFKEGQYVTVHLDIPGEDGSIVRCYSLSDISNGRYYRITVKKLPPPADNPCATGGRSSTYLFEQLEVGDVVKLQAPRGEFVMDYDAKRPAVMLAGGVGLTPMMGILNAVALNNCDRDVWVFHSVRNVRELLFEEYLNELAGKCPRVKVSFFLSRGIGEQARELTERYRNCRFHSGKLTLQVVAQYVATLHSDYYICGPPSMVGTFSAELANWGVADEQVFIESFCEATVKSMGRGDENAVGHGTVSFDRVGKSCSWSPGEGTLLEFAEKNGISLDHGCRAGHCGSCAVRICSGKVRYATNPAAKIESGWCLACSAYPDGDLTLDV